jgi:hypothetical protein
MVIVKASLKNRGNGRLQFVNDILKFYLERGRFKKQSEIVREIPLIDIENAALLGNEFSVTWKGVADIFVVETVESAKTICEEMNSALKNQEESMKKNELAEQEQSNLANIINIALDLSDALFDMLWHLHGKTDWTRIEEASKRAQENAKKLPRQTATTTVLNFTKLSSPIKKKNSEEVSKIVYDVLKSVLDYLNELTLNKKPLSGVHANNDYAKRVVLAYYTLNDIIFGIIVGDEEIEKEKRELVIALKDLEKTMDVNIDPDAIENAIDTLGTEEVNEGLIAKIRTSFRQQLSGFLTAQLRASVS